MDMKSNGSAYRRIKGFTLVEMIVVIAIIAILAGVMNLATQGFVKNARMESADDKARLLFTGFQNIVTQCEIKQDNSVLSYDGTHHSTYKTAVVTFDIRSSNVQSYQISNTGTASTDNQNGPTRTYGTAYNGGSVKYTDAVSGSGFCKLPNEIMGIIDNTFEGNVKVYIDFVNYEVKSVIFQGVAANGTVDANINSYQKISDKSTGFDYYGLYSRDDRNNLYDGKRANNTFAGATVNIASGSEPGKPLQCGVYPYQKDLYG